MKKIISFMIVMMAMMFAGCAQVDQTERGLLLEFGKVDEVIDPGLTIYNIFTKDVVMMSVATNLETIKINSGSKDMQDVNVTVAVNYRLDPTKIKEIYTQYGKNVVTVALQPQVKATITGVTPQYIPEEMLQKREEIRSRMEQTLRSKLDSANTHIIVESLTITSFDFSPAFKAAIEEKQVAEQNALREKNISKKKEYENQQAVDKARADSTVIALQMSALQKQNGKDYLMMKYLEKWDGHLPQVQGGASTIVMPELK